MAWTISNAMVRAYVNSNYSPEQVVASWAESCSDIESSAPSNTTPTPDQFYWPDKTTEHSRLSRFGMMCERLTADSGEDLLTWYREGFRVPTSVQQGPEQESMARQADCGITSGVLLAKYDRVLSEWKTAQCSLLGDSERFLETWPRWGMTRNGVAYLRSPSVPTMSETASGYLLPTPTCHNAKEGAYPAEYTRNTPTLATHVGGKIHPNFTEWMMGWPMDWTDLKPLATGKYQAWLNAHGKSSQFDSKRQKQE